MFGWLVVSEIEKRTDAKNLIAGIPDHQLLTIRGGDDVSIISIDGISVDYFFQGDIQIPAGFHKIIVEYSTWGFYVFWSSTESAEMAWDLTYVAGENVTFVAKEDKTDDDMIIFNIERN